MSLYLAVPIPGLHAGIGYICFHVNSDYCRLPGCGFGIAVSIIEQALPRPAADFGPVSTKHDRVPVNP